MANARSPRARDSWPMSVVRPPSANSATSVTSANAEADSDRPASARARGGNFLQQLIAADVQAGKFGGRVVTRFPPEPNGFLHIGHAKAICVNFGLAQQFAGGRCHLRMDDTNPTTEDMAFVEAIQQDIRWLGFDWGEHLYFASDYFEQLYEFACRLIDGGHAYVDSSSEAEIREMRGTLAEPGVASKYRDRSVAENRDFFARMRAGEFADGAHVLRAKIDLAAANMKLRDPLLYRIRHAHHFRTGDAWCIYPMYDFAHCLEDAIEGVTHSLCTLEFENNRAIYDWVLQTLELPEAPQQTEFARLALTGVVTSKRKVLALVQAGRVSGWDDARLATLAGLRRRGLTPESIRNFCERVGVAKSNSVVDWSLLDYCVRDDLNHRAPRVLCVREPLEVVLDNIAADEVTWLDAPHWPHDVEGDSTRKLPFSRRICIERDDFREAPEAGFKRLEPGRVVRLRHAEVIRCDSVERCPEDGRILRLRASVLDRLEDGGYQVRGSDERLPRSAVRATIHWLSAEQALPIELRLYEPLFLDAEPEGSDDSDPFARLNPDALRVVSGALVEPSVAQTPVGHYQFERIGYFFADSEDCTAQRLVFNRTVSLRDSWSSKQATAQREATAQPVPAKSKGRSTSAAKPRPERKTKAEQREIFMAAHPELASHETRYREQVGLAPDQAEVLTSAIEHPAFFDAALASAQAPAPVLARWFVNELLGALRSADIVEGHGKVGPEAFAALVAGVESGDITGPIAKDVLAVMIREGGVASAIIESRGWAPLTDDAAIAREVDACIDEHPAELARYVGGQKGLMGFFIGAVMKATGGKADPKAVRALVVARLDAAAAKGS